MHNKKASDAAGEERAGCLCDLCGSRTGDENFLSVLEPEA
jgi:hypothetical protein